MLTDNSTFNIKNVEHLNKTDIFIRQLLTEDLNDI